MKKVIAVLLSLCLLFTTACGASDTAISTGDRTEANTSEATTNGEEDLAANEGDSSENREDKDREASRDSTDTQPQSADEATEPNSEASTPTDPTDVKDAPEQTEPVETTAPPVPTETAPPEPTAEPTETEPPETIPEEFQEPEPTAPPTEAVECSHESFSVTNEQVQMDKLLYDDVLVFYKCDSCGEEWNKAIKRREEDYESACITAANQMIARLNADREAMGLSVLTTNPEWTNFAQIRAREAAEKYSHWRPNGSYCTEFFGEYMIIAENLGMGGSSGNVMYENLYGSPAHYTSMMDDKLSGVGVGVYVNEDGLTYCAMSLLMRNEEPEPSEEEIPEELPEEITEEITENPTP